MIADSRTLNLRPGPGEAIWSPALPPHRVRNVGDRDLRLIAVELESLR